MAQITETLTPRKFEIIRDRVAEILADELLNQSILNTDPNLAATVYLERLVPFSQDELPVVNVFVADGKFDRFTVDSQTGEHIIAIDIFDKGITEGSTKEQRGDLISTRKMTRIVGVVQAIFSHWKYLKLGFAENFIDRVEIQSYKLMEPISAADGSNVAKGRVLLYVKSEECLASPIPVLIDGYDTSVLLHETQYGYAFSGDQSVIPPITCAPGMAKNSDGVDIIEVPSGGFQVIIDSRAINSNASFELQVLAAGVGLIPDSQITVKDPLGNIIVSQNVPSAVASDVIIPAMGFGELRYDFVDPYSYCGDAPSGSLESAAVWNISRIEVLLNGTTIILSAANVAWDDRLTVIYI
jgi:hypothetical protein